MASHIGTPDVGAIDPELQTSPVVEEMAQDADAIRQIAPDHRIWRASKGSHWHDSMVGSSEQRYPSMRD